MMPKSLSWAVTILKLSTLGSAATLSFGSGSGSSLQQPGNGGLIVNNSSDGLDLINFTIPPRIRSNAHAYFMSSTDGQIEEITLKNGVPMVPLTSFQVGPSNEDNYAYAWAVQNSTNPPSQVFEKYTLTENLFQDSFDLITQVPASGQGPKTPYPGRHYEGARYPATLPGKIDMYLEDNSIGYGMWYRDIVFMLKVLHDAEVGKPEKGLLGYYDFQFWGFLNGNRQPHKIVHGFFRPA